MTDSAEWCTMDGILQIARPHDWEVVVERKDGLNEGKSVYVYEVCQGCGRRKP